MKQGIVGFVVGVLLAAAVFAVAGKVVPAASKAPAPGEGGPYRMVAVPGFATKDGYQPASAWKIDTRDGGTEKL